MALNTVLNIGCVAYGVCRLNLAKNPRLHCTPCAALLEPLNFFNC